MSTENKVKRYEDMDKFELVNEYGDLIDSWWSANGLKSQKELDEIEFEIEKIKTLILQRMS